MRPCVIKNIYLLKTILHLSGGSQQRQTNSSEFQCVSSCSVLLRDRLRRGAVQVIQRLQLPTEYLEICGLVTS